MTASHSERLRLAEQSVAAVQEHVFHTYHRLSYHPMPPAYWMNDPNGLIQWKGTYHLFYQHHPYSPEWGPMYWGHMTSNDLVHWKHESMALAPGEEYDKDGCFSGCAVDHDGTLTLLYTGNIWLKEDQTELKQSQCIAVSEDGITFTKAANNPVIAEPPAVGSSHFRDPKVWKHADTWYMVLGTRYEDNGKVVLYRSTDLYSWEYVSVVAESTGKLGFMWECPDLFHLDGHDVLVISPEGMESEGDKYQNNNQSGYLIGTFDYETGKLTHGEFEELDKGFDFYAPQTFLDEKGRRIVIGWMNMWRTAMPTQADGWAGAMTIARELRVVNGKVMMKPVEELKQLRSAHMSVPSAVVTDKHMVQDIAGDVMELQLSFSLQDCTAERFGIKLRCSETEETVLLIDVNEQTITFDRGKSGLGDGGMRRTALPVQGEDELHLHIFMDRSSLEVFINGGETVMTGRIYPSENSTGIQLFAEGGSVSVSSFDTWTLANIWEK